MRRWKKYGKEQALADTSQKMVKRLNTTLPDPLALYVGEMTGKGALYETPSEFIRDLVRRHMERTLEHESKDIRAMLVQSVQENDYSDWTDIDLADARKAAVE
jgi:Arc/MetJ-type ribon-helix-helix transcriptional regulator